MPATTTTAALSLALALAAPPARYEEAPGGYYHLDENREREPDNGDKKTLVGSILVPLGALRLGLGVGMYVMASPRYCNRIYGANITDKSCQGLQVYGLVGVGMGGLMAVTGAVFLAWGLTQRAKHNRWMREHGMAVAPMLGRDVQGVTLGFRF